MEKIIVVEDEVSVRSNIVSLLSLNGFRTLEAEDGSEALEKIKFENPDLIISDVMMPKIDGFELLEELQKSNETSTIPFIFLTAKTDPSDIRKGMTKGADDYIPKPFKAADLLNAINTRLKKKKQVDKKFIEIKDHIAKYIPHELRTPLIPILGYSQMMCENVEFLTAEDIKQMANGINDGGKRLHTTVEKFINYSEAEAILKDSVERSKIKKEQIDDVKNFIESEARIAAVHHKRKDDLKLNLDDSNFTHSKTHLATIIREITENAFKFSNPESEVEVKGIDLEKSYRLFIRNNGIGMTKDQIKKISAFLQFERDSYQQEGVGLGLITAKLLSEALGGNLFVMSEKNKYTEVIIEIVKQ